MPAPQLTPAEEQHSQQETHSALQRIGVPIVPNMPMIRTVQSPNRGLGVFANKLIPRGYSIIEEVVLFKVANVRDPLEPLTLTNEADIDRNAQQQQNQDFQQLTPAAPASNSDRFGMNSFQMSPSGRTEGIFIKSS